ncbi:MAG: pentapeptide repeat-containing protein [bacterium]|nr:pentapeptide repeat-containing protein [bacterium]
MANKKHVELVMRGAEALNQWRLSDDGRAPDLRGAHLSGAHLRGANLSWANLSWAHLSGAHLRGANLSWANLSGANLSWANLSGANLSGANLSWANLREANLSGANLSGAAPPLVLLAGWGEVSDDLCRDLMRYDCANHPRGKKAFDEWANGGDCPYSDCAWGRAAHFQERRDLWVYGPSQSALKLVTRLLKEKCNIKEE